MNDSVRQIKFELISYVKAFGGDFTQWSVGTAEDAPKALFQMHEVDPVQDVWLWKPAVTPAAAALVVGWMTDRQKVNFASGDADGANVFLFKKASAR